MKFFIPAVVYALVLAWCAMGMAAAPRVAVWDPVAGTRQTRFSLDLAAPGRLAGWLKDGGVEASLLSAEQIASPETLTANRYDAIFFIGSAFPRTAIPSLKRFADEGGVLVTLEAQVPFLIAIEPGADGMWVLSPQEPRFAWQTTELLKHLGLQYVFDATLHDQGVCHTATPLFRQYLPEARDLRGRLPSRWIVPQAKEGGTIYPLLRSQRADGADVPPPIYAVVNGQRRAIVCTDSLFTAGSRPKLWNLSQKTVAALAHLAGDLRASKVTLKPEMAVTISPRPPLKAMALDRMPLGSVEPEGATPVVRWGEFDGSAAELGQMLNPGAAVQIKAGSPPADFPAALDAQSSVRLELPPLPAGRLYLRIRGAYLATGAALRVQIGDEVVLNESFVYVDTSGPGNFSRSLAGMPVEFTRLVYLPPSARGAAMVLSNGGRFPVYFDAMQIEQRTQPARQRMVGLGAPMGKLASPELARQWSGLRMSMRTQFIGPPEDPKRFDKVDELFNRAASLNPNVEPILEGTPAWAAISPERLEEAQKAKRPTTVPPDPHKYAQIVEQVVRRYGDRIGAYEIWNEADITQFYRGSSEEYIKLFDAIVPIVRRLDPTARIMLTGMAGYREEFIRKMADAGILDRIDLVAFHPYAGKSPGWDIAYGLVEGCLLSHGCGKEVYCNESGFPSVNSEWFVPPPQMTPQTQHDLLNVAVARLLANGVSKLSVFNAGADGNAYGLFDRAGKPMPAYEVIADYARLGQNDARRLDMSFTGEGDAALQGIYAAAASHADGSATIVLNPAECDVLQPPLDSTPQLAGSAGWVCFFGSAKFGGGSVAVEPEAGKTHAGFYKSVRLDPTLHPTLEVVAGGSDADWELVLKQGGTVIPAAARQGAGTVRVELAKLLPAGGARDVEVSFRIYKPTTLTSVRFVPAGNTPPEIRPVMVRLRVPLSGSTPVKATMTAGGVQTPLAARVERGGGEAMADVVVPLQHRSVVRIEPEVR